MSAEPGGSAARPGWEVLLAVAAVSFGALASEVALTRIFSVLFLAPYVFLIVSTAIGGLGLGGLLAFAVRPDPRRLPRAVSLLAALFPLTLAAPPLLLFGTPWGRDLVAHAEIAVVVGAPAATFTTAGALIALLLRQYSGSAGLIYGVDLAAAGLAAAVAVPMLDSVGPLAMPLCLAVVAALAGLLLAMRQQAWWPALTAFAAACLLGVAGFLTLVRPWMSLPPLKQPEAAFSDPTHPWNARTKPLFRELGSPLSSAYLVRTDWTSVCRSDVTYDARQQAFYIYADGDVPAPMEPWDGSLEATKRRFADFAGTLPYRLLGRPPRSVLAIGAGGGLDALLAHTAGAERVEAVDINPAVPNLARDSRFRHTYIRVYEAPGVRLRTDDGRASVGRSGRYDVIYSACAKSATTQSGGAALLDNHLYTVEAFRAYHRRLTDDGILAVITQEAFLIDRLMLTALAAIRAEGAPHATSLSCVLTARLHPSRFREGPYRHVLLMRRRPWGRDEQFGALQAIKGMGMEPLFIPAAGPRGAEGASLTGSLDSPEALQSRLEGQYQVPVDLTRPDGPAAPARLAPATDDSPFYLDIAPRMHPALGSLLWGSGLALLASLLLAGLLAWRAAGGAGPRRLRASAAPAAYFALLGAGFILAELALMQKLVLLLGFPTLSLTVTLFALLLGGALGSLFVQRLGVERVRPAARVILPGLALLLVLYAAGLASVVAGMAGLSGTLRTAAAVLVLLPAGFLMGVPFPAGLRLLPEGERWLTPALWCVNGAATVFGSVATMVIAREWGYGWALGAAALCYSAAWMLFSSGRTTGVGSLSTASTQSPT